MTNPPDREMAVFSAARRLPAGQRAAYLDETCAGDAALRQRVEELLQAGEEAGAFLQEPASGAQRPSEAAGPSNAGATLLITLAPAEKAGDPIRRYKVLQQIGESRCGVDYIAQQQEPLPRHLAPKAPQLCTSTRN